MGATDSKLAFRKGVFRLFEERNVPATADDYWSLFWTLPESNDDVYTLVGSTDIRRARDGARENLETLIDKIMQQMDSQLHSNTPLQPNYLLNCCRVLTRIMPYVFETPDSDWEHNFFWTCRLIDNQKFAPRAEQLITMTLESLFLAGFTLPTMSDAKINYVIWETGVGSSTPIGSSRDNDMNRTEVLRLLTVLLSKSMYISPSHILSKSDPWLHYVVSKLERKIVLAVLCSMINTCCKYNPLGWSAVPYNHIMYTDQREQLVAVALRILLILLDYRSPHTIQQESTDETMENAFRYYLSKLHRAQDFQFLIDGIYRILSNPMQSLNSYLPGSSKKVRYHVEMMMLCWKLLEMNNRFRSYLIETERALDLMIVIIFYASENKLDPSQVGVVRMCAFILQTLSSDRTFSVKLNKHFEGHASLPVNIRLPNFQGSYADYLILTIFSLIASSRGTLSTLYPALIKTITNISPYLKNLSALTCTKLISLFNSISAPGFLFADESNHFLLEYLLEAFNNIIQFQFSNNPNLIFAILRNHQKFQKLQNFALLDLPEDDTLSEKARGKLPESSLSRVSSTSSIPHLSSIHGLKNGFTPTEDWINQWHPKLPLGIIQSIITDILPCINLDTPNLDVLRSFNVNLPPSHPICIRKFQWKDPLVIWFRSMLWGQTYISSVSNYGPWNHTNIKLFHIKQPEISPRPSLNSTQ